METIILIISASLLFFGIVGSIVPVLPGPPISFFALILLHFLTSVKFDEDYLLIIGFLVGFVTFLDYWLQVYGVKKFGGGKKATNGTILGLIIGIFILPPIGILIGPFIGAFIGAKMEKENKDPIKIAFGSVLGLLAGTFLKIVLSLYITYLAIVTFI